MALGKKVKKSPKIRPRGSVGAKRGRRGRHRAKGHRGKGLGEWGWGRKGKRWVQEREERLSSEPTEMHSKGREGAFPKSSFHSGQGVSRQTEKFGCRSQNFLPAHVDAVKYWKLSTQSLSFHPRFSLQVTLTTSNPGTELTATL